MQPILKPSALALIAATTALLAVPGRGLAQGYPIDCAILLCLAGGWPASEPCTRARAEVIRRITPWPVEPPLQIWRCPMGAADTFDPDREVDRIHDVLLDRDARSAESEPTAAADRDSAGGLMAQPDLAQIVGTRGDIGLAPLAVQNVTPGADVDISSPEFDFVRSIRVYHVTFAGQQEDDDPDGSGCNRTFAMRIGSYGPQGEFGWRPGSNPGQLPAAHVGLDLYGLHCPSVLHRSVFVDWRAYDGSYGFEQVTY